MRKVDIAIIGGGPAGMAAAVEAFKSGIKDIVILERDRSLGGILPQCIHNGFGLHIFGEELTGPEYAGKFIDQITEMGIEYKLNTMVLDISKDKVITAVNSEDGLLKIKAGAVILAMGCRERTRGALNIPGSRPSGIYTAGTAQRFVNIEGFMPGKKVVILGSGDIGLIMARRMTLEGAEVKMVCEIMPYSSGLNRNIVQCLEDYGIPLRLSHTVVKIHGNERLEGVTVAKVDKQGKPIEETFEYVECDTLLLSVGLIPENELTKGASIEMDAVTAGPVVNESAQTSQDGIFACGNVVYVHDLVDYVTQEGYIAGKSAAEYLLKGSGENAAEMLQIKAGHGIRCVVPQYIRKNCGEKVKLFLRVAGIFRNGQLEARSDDELIYSVRKRIVTPGEMESISLTAEMIQSIKSGNVDISLKCSEGEVVQL